MRGVVSSDVFVFSKIAAGFAVITASIPVIEPCIPVITASFAVMLQVKTANFAVMHQAEPGRMQYFVFWQEHLSQVFNLQSKDYG